MTRQWLAQPQFMCRQHLLGEHFEAHIFLSKMEKGYSLQGFRDGSMFFGAEFLLLRHDLLATYIAGHQTPLIIPPALIEKYPLVEPTLRDLEKSMVDLLTRCEKCQAKHSANFLGSN